MARTNQHWSEHVTHISQGVDHSPDNSLSLDAILYHHVVDFPDGVAADGKHHHTLTIMLPDIQAARSKDGHTGTLSVIVKLVAWGSDGLPKNVNMTKVSQPGDDISVPNVSGKLGLVTTQKEGCSDVRAIAGYTDSTVFDLMVTNVQVCVSELDKDKIAVNHLCADLEKGEAATLQVVTS